MLALTEQLGTFTPLHSLQSMTRFDHLKNVSRYESAVAKSESVQGQVSKSQSEIKLWKHKYEVKDLDWHY